MPVRIAIPHTQMTGLASFSLAGAGECRELWSSPAVHGIVYRFETFDALSNALETEDREVRLPSPSAGRDGEWLLATFFVGSECTSIAGRVCDRGAERRLTFEARDWDLLLRFSEGGGPVSGAALDGASAAHLAVAPPGTTALVVGSEDGGLRSIVCEMLGRWGIGTECVASAEEALAWLGPHQAELVVMNVNLPGMPPEEFCRVLREPAQAAAAMPKILLLAADTRRGEVAEALNAGADDFIAMPFRAPELRCRVLGLLRRSLPPA